MMFVRFLKDLRVLAFSASRRSKKGQEAPKTAPRWPKRPPSEPQDGLPPSPVLSPPRLEASLRAKSRTAATSMLSLHLRPAGAACTSREQRRRGTFFWEYRFKQRDPRRPNSVGRRRQRRLRRLKSARRRPQGGPRGGTQAENQNLPPQEAHRRPQETRKRLQEAPELPAQRPQEAPRQT